MSMRVRHIKAWTVGVAVAAVAVVAAAAVVAGGSPTRADEARAGEAAPAVKPAQAFAVLRAPARRPDGEAAVLRQVGGRLAEAGDALPAELRSIDVARYAGVAEGQDQYVVAGDATVCLFSAPEGARHGFSGGCGHAPEATGGSRPVGTVEYRSDATQVVFLVPDDVTTASLVAEGGADQRLHLADNIAWGSVPGAASSMVLGLSGGGARTVPLGGGR